MTDEEITDQRRTRRRLRRQRRARVHPPDQPAVPPALLEALRATYETRRTP